MINKYIPRLIVASAMVSVTAQDCIRFVRHAAVSIIDYTDLPWARQPTIIINMIIRKKIFTNKLIGNLYY